MTAYPKKPRNAERIADTQRLLAILDEKHFECQRHDLPQILVDASTIRVARRLLRESL